MYAISSVACLSAAVGLSLYTSTKFAVEGLSEDLAQELINFRIKLTIIEPRPFRTDFAGNSIKISSLHPEYKDSASTLMRNYLQKIDGNQEGDPVKAAQIMIQLSKMEKPPLRLPLGKIAMERIEVKFQLKIKTSKHIKI